MESVIVQKHLTYTPKQPELEGSGFRSKLKKKTFEGREKASFKVAAPFIGMIVSA